MSERSTPTTRRLKSQTSAGPRTPGSEDYPIKGDFLKKGTLPTGEVRKKGRK